jgi:competence protein ComEC
MKRAAMAAGVCALALFGGAPASAQNTGAPAARNLDIYWIDTEGGAATLVINPAGESLLVDTGFAVGDRDAKRIHEAALQAGLTKIDYLLISHYHADHVGGLAAFAKMMPIGRFFDHGDTVDAVDKARHDGYVAVAEGKRTVVKPGDTIPIKGFEALVVTSDEKLLPQAVNGGGPNPLCATAVDKTPAGGENQRNVGLLLTYGKFKFLNLIDLDWHGEMELSCPVNKFGTVTVYQSGRHGSLDGAGAPAFLGAIKPQVVIVNNGPRKGLGQRDDRISVVPTPGRETAPFEANSYLRLAKLPGIEGIWQGHLSLLDKDPNHNTTPDMIANVEDTADCQGHWIKASVAPDGSFTVTNSRNGFSKNYVAK